MRNLKSIFLAALVALVLAACEKIHLEEQEASKTYEIMVDNRLSYESVSQKSDAVLYDINLISSNGEVYSLGSVEGGKAKVFTLPQSHKDLDVLIMALKIGRNRSEAMNSLYLCPEIERGTIQPIFVVDGKLTDITIFSSTTWSQTKYSTVGELRRFAKEIALGNNSK